MWAPETSKQPLICTLNARIGRAGCRIRWSATQTQDPERRGEVVQTNLHLSGPGPAAAPGARCLAGDFAFLHRPPAHRADMAPGRQAAGDPCLQKDSMFPRVISMDTHRSRVALQPCPRPGFVSGARSPRPELVSGVSLWIFAAWTPLCFLSPGLRVQAAWVEAPIASSGSMGSSDRGG